MVFLLLPNYFKKIWEKVMEIDKATKMILELTSAGSCLKPEDIAAEVEHVLALPRHVQPRDIRIRATHQRN